MSEIKIVASEIKKYSSLAEIPLEVIQKIYDKAKPIKLLLLDVDGVLSNGTLYIGSDGKEYKGFSTHDGIGIKMLLRSGVEVAVLSGRKSKATVVRMKSLGVKHIYQGQERKFDAYIALRDRLKLRDEEIAYVGDDVPDVPILKVVGLGITVPNAMPMVLDFATWITEARGGEGAVREVCEFIMGVQDTLVTQLAYYF